MTEHHKEGYSLNWFWIVAILLIGWGFIQAAITDLERSYEAEVVELPPPKPIPNTVKNVEEYFLVRAEWDHDTNTCSFRDTTLFQETVFVVYPDKDPNSDTVGQWDSTSNTISLMQPGGLDITSVAHEVAHMVDTFMSSRPDLDPHYGMYMQGYWTDCVYRILQHDLEAATISKTKFPD